VAQMLRQLAQYYQKDANNLFVVRLAQGLLHMGKGTVSIAPYHANRQLLSPVTIASLFTVLVGFLDVKSSTHHRAAFGPPHGPCVCCR
jgi:26S proteasome regulatory subunit N1